jgi:uncharacterized protein (DUF697 family)
MSEVKEKVVVDQTAPAAGHEPAKIETKLEYAEALVRKNVYIAAGVSIVPVPLFDMVALSGLQMNMLYRLSKKYEIPFSKDVVKSLIASLIGGVAPATVARQFAYSFMKTIPLIGATLGGLALPILAGASTYALGKIFIQHFESGGTFLTFDPKAVKEHFARLHEEGRAVVMEAVGAR